MSAELAGKLDRALAAYESIATSLGDAANNGYFQAKIAELKARMASNAPIKGNGLRRKPCRFPVRREENGLLPQGLSPFAQGRFFGKPCGSDPFPPRFKHEDVVYVS